MKITKLPLKGLKILNLMFNMKFLLKKLTTEKYKTVQTNKNEIFFKIIIALTARIWGILIMWDPDLGCQGFEGNGVVVAVVVAVAVAVAVVVVVVVLQSRWLRPSTDPTPVRNKEVAENALKVKPELVTNRF